MPGTSMCLSFARLTDTIRMHVDLIPNNAPADVIATNRKRIAENERDFRHAVRHYGASHAIMITDPKPIIANILRYVDPIERVI